MKKSFVPTTTPKFPHSSGQFSKTLGSTLILSAFLTLIDQLTKAWAIANISYSQNPGIAFSIPIPSTVMIAVTVLFIPLIIYTAVKELNLKKPLSKAALALVIGGALGNLIDRVTLGAVTDFIRIGSWPSFNLADAYITAGILLLIVFYDKIKKN